MMKLKFLSSCILLSTASTLSQANEIELVQREVLEIRVEEESECNSEENTELFKKIEKEQNVTVKCIFENGHIYDNVPLLQSSGPRRPIRNFLHKISQWFKSSESEEYQETTEKLPQPEIDPSNADIAILDSDDTLETAQSIELDSASDIYVEPFTKTLESDPDLPYTTVTTYFATDRAHSPIYDPYKQFGNDIYQGESSYLLGRSEVTIPKDKKPGISSQPGFLTFFPKPEHHTILQRNDILSSEQFFQKIIQNPNKKSFILLHGYNVSFSAAAIQTAELAYDLEFAGTPIFYSWPSKTKLLGYFADRETIESSQLKFAEFLTEYLENSPQELYLIAHSMGSQALIHTLENQLPKNPKLQKHLKGIIFVAPDVATTKFNNTIQKLSKFNVPVTLYGSQKDLALSVSHTISAHQRAGFLKPIDEMVKIKGLEVIDATNVRADLLGHALSPMSSDISELMLGKIKAKFRSKLQETRHGKETYFILNK